MADVIGEDDVVGRGIEKPAGREEHVGELRPEELMPVAARAVHDEHGVRHMPLGVADGRAQRRVVQPHFVHRLAGVEAEIVDDEIAFLARQLGRSRARPAQNKNCGHSSTPHAHTVCSPIAPTNGPVAPPP